MIKINKIIRTKRRTIALVIERDGSLVVRAPLRATNARIQEVVKEKADWVLAKQKLVKTVYLKTKPKEYVNGEGFWYLGKTYPLEIVNHAKLPLVLDRRFHLSQAALPKARSVFKNWYRKQATQIISERVLLYASRNGFTYDKIRITSARTRWGSCTSRSTLCFTWRLVMAPMAVIDYVVVHELVHLQEKNHSKSFWGKVKALMPDYKRQIAWLKANGHLLTLE
ncbi:MAG: M48 family metallopeptidase [Anaerolineales bacterium]|nr:M48 family metallopeptidase [Anaerolineales bacterium]